MNSAVKGAIPNPQSASSYLRAALFHSTPVLERGKRQNYWENKTKRHNRRQRTLRGRQQALHNVSSFAEYLLQGWKHDFDEDDPSSSWHTSWFRKEYSKESRRNQHGPRSSNRRHFEFCDDDDEFDIDHAFRSAFGGNRSFFWSFTYEEEPRWRRSSKHSNYYRRSWNSRYREEEEDYSSTDSESSESNLTSDRLALGLSVSGPLNLEEVKNAYRACALKWHPDRHQGSSKAVAEEKFKLCSAAYQSLCDKLAVN